jgi:hypothetical protein
MTSLLSLSEHINSNILENDNFNNNFLNNIEEQIFSSIEEDVPIVLKESSFNNLLKLKFKNLENKYKIQDICVIGLDKFEDNTEVVILPCEHIFNLDNCKNWLLNNSHKCPICRKSAGETIAKI